MRFISLLLCFAFGSLAFAAGEQCDTSSKYRPAQEYCYVWVGNEEEMFTRKVIQFQLDLANHRKASKKNIVVDDQVKVEIVADLNTYRMALFARASDNDATYTRLAEGRYHRTGALLDFDVAGFTVYRGNTEYTFRCGTESYISE